MNLTETNKEPSATDGELILRLREADAKRAESTAHAGPHTILGEAADALENYIGICAAWKRDYDGEKKRGDAWMADCKKAEALVSETRAPSAEAVRLAQAVLQHDSWSPNVVRLLAGAIIEQATPSATVANNDECSLCEQITTGKHCFISVCPKKQHDDKNESASDRMKRASFDAKYAGFAAVPLNMALEEIERLEARLSAMGEREKALEDAKRVCVGIAYRSRVIIAGSTERDPDHARFAGHAAGADECAVAIQQVINADKLFGSGEYVHSPVKEK